MNDDKLNQLHAMAAELIANTTDATSRDVRARMARLMSGGYDMGDTLHNVYLDYGYPQSLTFDNFWNMYRRFGVAKNVIELPVAVGWQTPPTIVASDKLLSEFDKLNDRLNVWQRIKGLDTRQRVGRYAGLFMRVRDNQSPDTPLDTLPGSAALMDMVPLYESQLEVVETDTDASSDTFGQPLMVQYSQSVTGNRNEEVSNTIKIHASRIVFAAEGADTGWIYGVPALESIYNSLMDLRKIIGGGAEGFYKNSSQSVVFNLQDATNASAYKDQLEAFNEQYDAFTRSPGRKGLWTPGMDANVLNSTLMSPKEFFEVALNDVAAGSGIPATILIGKQTGRLASEEDSAHFLSVVQSRRENFGSELVARVLDWCMEHGVLPTSDYELEWDDLLARSDAEKLANAKELAMINKEQFNSGGSVPFTGEEIREAAGFEPEELEDPGGEDI